MINVSEQPDDLTVKDNSTFLQPFAQGAAHLPQRGQGGVPTEVLQFGKEPGDDRQLFLALAVSDHPGQTELILLAYFPDGNRKAVILKCIELCLRDGSRAFCYGW